MTDDQTSRMTHARPDPVVLEGLIRQAELAILHNKPTTAIMLLRDLSALLAAPVQAQEEEEDTRMDKPAAICGKPAES